MTSMTVPDETEAVAPPGDTLARELASRDMTQTELAQQMGRPLQMVNEIVRGKKSITARTALELEEALGISAQMWLNMEAGYRLSLERQRRQQAPH